MKFKFFHRESKIYDFLQFPNLLYLNGEIKDSKEEEFNFSSLIDGEYMSIIGDAENKIKPFKKEIENFYNENNTDYYHFIELIFREYTFFGYNDEKEYLNMLLNLNSSEIITSIIYSLMIINGDYHSYSQEIMDNAKVISESRDRIISLINELSIEPGFKWKLFLIIEDPIKYLNLYVDLMLKLLPIYEEFYMKFNDKIILYGQEIANKINEENLEEITYSIIKPDVINREENNLLVSIIYSYVIRIMTVSKKNYIVWGIKMEDAFKKMREINENKTIERVQVFKNLGDKTRYEVLKLISAGESSIKKIAETLDVSSATISYHINNLVTSKVIKVDKTLDKYGYIVDYKLLEQIVKGFEEDMKFPKIT